MRLLLCAFLFTITSTLFAQPFKMEPGPKSPADSLACIKTRPGFKVELMVSEPLVQSPIAFAWGPDGKFWVVEMGDYPLGVPLTPDPSPKGRGETRMGPGGKIKYLEKTKPDGPYDKMTVFMDGLGFPTGVFPYKNGVLVTCAPDIFYAEVGKDGKVKKEVLFTGFIEGNQQHRVNGLVWGIDNWIYGANGDSGGLVKSIKTGKVTDIRGRDFRLKPDTGEFEAVSGQSQFGRCRDDWGNWFGNNNSNPMFHYVLEDRYLKRNPHVLYPDVRVQVPIRPGAQAVYPISKPMPRFNTPGALNHFTSACSTIIYRDTLFGKEFEGNMFVSEPVHNLIHREIMKPKGVTFTSQRADDEQASEFLASSDNWFRPAMIQVGPDGALWIADMYRYVIEHPEWIPKDWQKKLDLRAGHDKGRVYRVYPADKKPREIVRLDKLKIEDLVKQLESPSGWMRDVVQQMFVTAANPAESRKSIEEFAKFTPVPVAQLHAVYSLNGFSFPALLLMKDALRNGHPRLQKHAVGVAAPLVFRTLVDLPQIASLAENGDSYLRQEIAYFLPVGLEPTWDGQKQLAKVFVDMLIDSSEDKYVVAACLSAITEHTWPAIIPELKKRTKIPGQVLDPILKCAEKYGKPNEVETLLLAHILSTKKEPSFDDLVRVGRILKSSQQGDALLKSYAANGDVSIQTRFRAIHAGAVKIISDPKASESTKLSVIPLFGRGLDDNQTDQRILLDLLTPQTSDEIQAAAVTQLSRTESDRIAGMLLDRWKSYSPRIRSHVLDTLLTRFAWARIALEVIRTKQVPASEIGAVHRQRLLEHKDAEVRDAAKTIFAAASDPNRGRVVDLYWLQLPDKADAERGAKLFAKTCATCHKLGSVGQNVGPDLMSIGDKSAQGLLSAILDPNRAVETRYINYVASTKKGLTYTGILSAETSTTITLTANDGKLHQLLRNELDDLSSTGKSMMPEGLEKDLSPRDVADVITYVRSIIAPAK